MSVLLCKCSSRSVICVAVLLDHLRLLQKRLNASTYGRAELYRFPHFHNRLLEVDRLAEQLWARCVLGLAAAFCGSVLR